MKQESVRDWIGRRVGDGRLPRVGAVNVWARNGRGLLCRGCGKPIEGGEVEYEMQWLDDQCRLVVRMHFSCYRIWESETRSGAAATL